MTPEPMEAVFCRLIEVVFSKAKDHGLWTTDQGYWSRFSVSFGLC